MEVKYLPYILIPVAIIVLIILIALSLRRRFHYEKRDFMLTDSEAYFYYLYKTHLPPGYEIIPQPSLINFFIPASKSKYMGEFNKIIAKRFDFCIVRHERSDKFPFNNFRSMAVIELDDSSHQRPERRERDEFVNTLCADYKLPLYRYKTKSNDNPNYDINQIKRDIAHITR